jgi:hypothetical protein
MKKFLSVCALLALSTVMALAADISGTWKGEANPNGKGGPPTFTFKADGSKLTGTMTAGRGGDVEITNGKIDGDKVYFEVTRTMGDNTMTTKYTGTVSGTTIKISAESARGTREMTLTKQ